VQEKEKVIGDVVVGISLLIRESVFEDLLTKLGLENLFEFEK